MKTMHPGKNRCATAGFAGLAALTGCQAEVGEEYTGEVLLSVGGSVVAGPEVPPDHELALVFNSRILDLYLVDGETTGEFPSRFRFEVTAPPPDEAIFQYVNDVDPHARASLVFVPKSHPPKFPSLLDRTSSLEPTGAEAYTVEGSRCRNIHADHMDPPEPKLCVQERFNCTSHACELEWETATPEMLKDKRPREIGYLSNSEGDSCTLTEYCTLDGCGHRLWCCELPEPGPDEKVQALQDSTQYSVCESEGVTGDPELVEFVHFYENMRLAATDLGVFYFERDQPPGSPMSRFKKGYTIVKYGEPPVPGEDLAWVLCEADARNVAFREYAVTSGQRYSPGGHAWRDDPVAEPIISARLQELMEECGEDPYFSGESELFHQGAGGLEITLGPWENGM
jgi:hypothetical protein